MNRFVNGALLLTLTSLLACGGGDDDDEQPAAAGESAQGGGGTTSASGTGGTGTAAGGITARRGAPAAQGGGSGGNGGSSPGASGEGGDSAPPAKQRGVWSHMGYDPKSQYFNPMETTISVENAATLELKWTFDVAGYPPGLPVIAEGMAFVMSTGGMYAIDIDDGKKVWQRDDIMGLSMAVAYHEGSIYVHGDPPELYRLNAADGKTIWGPVVSSELPGADGSSSPVVVGDKVLVGQSNGYAEIMSSVTDAVMRSRGGVRAFSVADGSPLWRYYTVPETGENGASVWSTVSVDEAGGVVYATTGNNYSIGGGGSDAIHAIDLATGAGLWVQQVRQGDTFALSNPFGGGEDTDFGANPIVADFGGRKLVAAGDKGAVFWAIDRESDTGMIAWSVPELSSAYSPANGGVLNNGAFDGTHFYVVSNQPPSNAVLHALKPDHGKPGWPPVTFNKITWGTPTVANGVLYVPINEDLYVVDAGTGKTLTMFPTGGSIAGGAAIADGRVIVKSGMQYVANLPVADVFNNNQIHCYGLPGGAAASGDPNAANSDATFTAVFDDVIRGTGCNGGGACHGGATSVTTLTMRLKDQAYDQLVGVPAASMTLSGMGPQCADSGLVRVVPFDPAASLLMHKLEGTQTCGDPMPPTTGLLSAEQVDRVRRWIARGAPRD